MEFFLKEVSLKISNRLNHFELFDRSINVRISIKGPLFICCLFLADIIKENFRSK
jgi:hypothetical protein